MVTLKTITNFNTDSKNKYKIHDKYYYFENH